MIKAIRDYYGKEDQNLFSLNHKIILLLKTIYMNQMMFEVILFELKGWT